MAKKLKILIGGRLRETKRELPVISPFDGKVVGTTYLGGVAELKEAAGAASGVFAELRAMPSYKRAQVLDKVVEGLESRAEELARTITLEAGKPIRDSRTEVSRTINTFRIASEESTRLGGEVLPLDIFPGAEGRFGIVRRFPVGPVLAITPFNFPLNLVAHKVAPSMACANPVIVKPASKTPLSALLLGEIITEAGWPAGGVNVVPSSGKDADRLIEDERIKKLTFTGSAAVGWSLKARMGARRITLELGGNAGVIVSEDSDLDNAAKRCTLGSFSYAGQICISVQRIYVQKKVFEKFKTLYLGEVGKLRLGDPMDEATDVGPMIEEGALARTEEWVNEAVSQGAKVLAGGKRKKNFFEPTVLTGTKPSMKVCAEEVFAPVVTLEPYDEFEDAVGELNRGLYGLQAGVFTNDTRRTFYAYEKIDAGGVIINDIPTFRVDNMPYGGIKMSGFGREGVRYAIEEMTELKLLALNTG